MESAYSVRNLRSAALSVKPEVMPETTSDTTPETRLTRAVIVEAAIALVARDGIEALTMRQVGKAIGRAPMSLYRHVAGRDDLLLGMLDLIADQIAVPPGQDDAVEDIVAVMGALHATMRAHPWLVKVLLFEGRGSLRVTPLIERVMAGLSALGLTDTEVLEVYSMLLHYTYGECLSFDTRDKRRDTQREMPEDALEAFPHVARAAVIAADWSYDEYARNIRRLLRSIR